MHLYSPTKLLHGSKETMNMQTRGVVKAQGDMGKQAVKGKEEKEGSRNTGAARTDEGMGTQSVDDWQMMQGSTRQKKAENNHGGAQPRGGAASSCPEKGAKDQMVHNCWIKGKGARQGGPAVSRGGTP